MIRVDRHCREVRSELASMKDLSAVEKSSVDLHLRRCDACRAAFEGLQSMETFQVRVEELSEDRKDRIYDRLVPAAFEISREYQKPGINSFWRPVVAFGAVVSAAAAAIFVAFLVQSPEAKDIETYHGAPTAAAIAMRDPEIFALENNAYVDRMEGDVLINDQPLSDSRGVFVAEKGTRIQQDESARTNFRIGRYARVALLDRSRLTVISDSPELLSVSLDSGKMAVEFDGSYGKRLEVHTQDLVVRVKGTIFTVEVLPNQATRVGVIEGQVEVMPIGIEQGTPVEIADGEMSTLPGSEGIMDLGDEQRALAGEVETVLDQLVATAGRIVHFAASPERVKVEVDNRFLGYTPLTVRLPSGPLDYRLSAPGMETVEARLVKEQLGESVTVAMNPSADYRPIVDRDRRPGTRKSAARGVDQVSVSLMTRARAALTAGDVAYAARLLDQAATGLNGEELVTALSLLAECYSASGDYVRAADTFDRVASLVPGTKIAQNSRYEVGRLAMDHIGDFGRARTAFTAYVASPLGGELKETAYFSLCELYGREGVPRSALQCFSDFMRTFPGGYRQASAQLWRGVLLQEVEQRWADAERDLLAFIHAKPRHPRCEEARYRIALGRYHQNNRKGALLMLDEYLREHPGGQYQVRVERLKRAILNPGFSNKAVSK